ncbi:hypothetical protein [Bacillus sp. B1-b2]|uniref:hypothetical protein n=1 Tax=Bacillus sp. B1-b2 TaxID=2653201 RepID=UPI0012623D37|nr:hypothetical protein [Bacillus sp. B1-b2]KAB7663031.1 hypothetical protein F9279_24360 [Bacillus sp. B1-b2]
MFTRSVKRSEIFTELQPDLNKQYFDRIDKKFLHNIDSFYYVIKVKNDWNYDYNVRLFINFLEQYRVETKRTYDPVVMWQNDDRFKDLSTKWLMNGLSFGKYEYDMGIPDKFNVFVLSRSINSDTPEFWVQLRSQYLWLDGEYKAVEESIKEIKAVLDVFGIEIEKISENRIDYAYHTNIIQDPTNFFSNKNANRMQQSRFKRGSLEFSFRGQFETDTDYFTLGRKKGNNLFFRVYDKTKEVIEKQYKQFFIKLWYLEKMISYYDMYCIEKAFLHVSNDNYKYLDVARLEFYLEYGTNDVNKNKILDLLEAKSKDYELIEKLADTLVPRVTKILNIEIETKRKFYRTMDESVNTLLKLHSSNVPEYAKQIYLKLDNKQVFHDHLVCNNLDQQGVIRFLDYKAKNKLGKAWTDKSKFPTADWWKRLQTTKVNRRFKVESVKLSREYQQKLSASIMKKKITNAITTYSLYIHGDDVQNDTFDDIVDYMATLNESDVEQQIQYKRKKMTLLADRLENVEGVSKFEKQLRVYDTETGQVF